MTALRDDYERLLFQRHYAELCMEWLRLNERRLGRKYDPNQPRVGPGNPAGGQWLGRNVARGGMPGYRSGYSVGSPPLVPSSPHSDTDHLADWPIDSGRPVAVPAQFLRTLPALRPAASFPPAASKAIESAIELYNYLTSRPNSGGPIVLELAPHEYMPSASYPFDLAFVRSLSREETQEHCPSLAKVQEIADMVSAEVRSRSEELTPQQIGTKIHYQIAEYIRAHSELGLFAEISLTEDGEDKYGKLGSVRADAMERVNLKSVYIYDFKTGNEGLSAKRASHLESNSFRAYGEIFRRYYIIEVRPRR